MAIRFEPDDLITAQWPPTGMITYGVPLTGAYAGQFCQLNSSGVIIPVGSNTSKAGTVTVSSAGTHTLTFGTAYGLAVQYIAIITCRNSKGSVSCNVLSQTESGLYPTGFDYHVSAAGTLTYNCIVINDIGSTT